MRLQGWPGRKGGYSEGTGARSSWTGLALEGIEPRNNRPGELKKDLDTSRLASKGLPAGQKRFDHSYHSSAPHAFFDSFPAQLSLCPNRLDKESLLNVAPAKMAFRWLCPALDWLASPNIHNFEARPAAQLLPATQGGLGLRLRLCAAPRLTPMNRHLHVTPNTERHDHHLQRKWDVRHGDGGVSQQGGKPGTR